jgi:hypothetical protein
MNGGDEPPRTFDINFVIPPVSEFGWLGCPVSCHRLRSLSRRSLRHHPWHSFSGTLVVWLLTGPWIVLASSASSSTGYRSPATSTPTSSKYSQPATASEFPASAVTTAALGAVPIASFNRSPRLAHSASVALRASSGTWAQRSAAVRSSLLRPSESVRPISPGSVLCPR